MKHLRRMRALAVVLASSISLAIAQSTSGNMAGVVYDPSGATVPGASMTARNEATGIESTTRSTSSGQYRLDNLPVGSYELSVSAAGFSRADSTGVLVALN
jgi:hypothetical protein